MTKIYLSLDQLPVVLSSCSIEDLIIFKYCFDVACDLHMPTNSTITLLQATWSLKMRALTELVYVDEIENDEEGIAEMLMDDNAIANVARPGTSLKKPPTAVTGGPTAAMR